MAIQLFDEHDNYFSHMPRLFKAPALNPTSGRDGLEPKTLFAADKPSLLTFSLFIICPFIARCLPSFLKKKNHFHLGHSFNNPDSQFLLEPPTPTPIPFTWLWWARVGESVTMETGAEAVEGSQWERRGEKETETERKSLRTGQCWGIHEQSVIWHRSDWEKNQIKTGNEWILFTGQRWKCTAKHLCEP